MQPTGPIYKNSPAMNFETYGVMKKAVTGRKMGLNENILILECKKLPIWDNHIWIIIIVYDSITSQ